jgi:GxxExxY protein
VIYQGRQYGNAFRADMVVNEKVIVELKSIQQTGAVHRKQLLTYLKLSGLKLGLLINFGQPLLKDGVTRLVNKL